MKLTVSLLLVIFLAGCSNANRTVPVLVWDERTVSNDTPREPLEIPKDYKEPKLVTPKNDTIISDWKKNDFKNYK